MKAILTAAAMGLILSGCGTAEEAGQSKSASGEVAELRAANDECRKLVDNADIESANPLCLSALEDAREFGEQSPEYAQAVANTAWLFHMRGQDEDAEQFYQRAVGLQEAQVDPEPRVLARTLADYGMLLTNGGDAEAGMARLERAQTLLSDAGAEESEAMAALYGDMAETYEVAGDMEASLEMYRASVAAYRKALGDAHANVGVALNNLGTALQIQRDFDAAEKVLKEAAGILKEALGAEHPVTGMAQANLRDNDSLREDAEARAEMAEEEGA